MQYDERYCAFVDILGFAELVGKLRHGATPFEALKELLAKIHNPAPPFGANLPDAEFRAQSISDAVALSSAANIKGLASIFHSLTQLAVDLLYQGFFIRGAIVKDRLYHDEKMVFGEGLVRAYRLENDVVVYPRVMVTREVAHDFKAYSARGGDIMLKQAEDGPTFLHVLRPIELVVNEARRRLGDKKLTVADDERLAKFATITPQLQRRFDEATDTPRHFAKVKWFAAYWNENVDRWDVDGLDRIKGAGLDRDFRD